MKLKLTTVYAVIIVFNIALCTIFYASQWVPIVSVSLQSPVNDCDGLQTFADPGFLKLLLVQTCLSVALHIAGVSLATNGLQHLKSGKIALVLILLPFIIAMIVLNLERFVVDCV